MFKQTQPLLLLGAAWAHAGNAWLISAANVGLEYSAFLAVAAAVQALLGDGKFALGTLFSKSVQSNGDYA